MKDIPHNETVLKNNFKFKNSSLPINERVKDLINQMTLEEKIAQMVCIWAEKAELLLDENNELDYEKLRKNLKNGMGQIGRLSDTGGHIHDIGLGQSALGMAELSNAIQKFFIEETRLGIPVIYHEECLHGLMGREATSFPQPIAIASSFNPGLVEEIYSVIAEETRARGAHQALTPVLDVARDARWGRVEETFGEDPYLISQLGIAAVKGFQGDCTFKTNDKLIATLKHFAAHGQPESGTNCGPANYSERFLRDTFLYPFKEVIEKAGAMSVMASYNEIDGVPSHGSKWLLQDILRGEFGFKGVVVSDYFAVTELFTKEGTNEHFVAGSKEEAAALAVKAGVNIELPDPDCYPALSKLVAEGIIDESEIDLLVTEILRHKFQIGLFENPYVDVTKINNAEKLKANRIPALRAAQESITLIKNEENLLPLNLEEIKSIAVIGPNADRVLLGGYSGLPEYNTTVLEGIKAKVGDRAEVLYSEGCKITVGGNWFKDEVELPTLEEDKKSIKEAVETAKKADVVILAIGGNEQTSREAWSKEHLGDRTSLDLFGRQNELVEELLKTGKPVIVSLFNGRPLSITNLDKHVPAILECWYLGQESGNAVADVIFGDFNPCGKLPISFPRSVGHIPCHYSHKPSSRRGYVFDDKSALYTFGYGLSYTSFELSNVKLEKDIIEKDQSTIVSVDVKNTGDCKGKEVVQLYIRDLISSVARPVKELKGFEKIELRPGESKTVRIPIMPDHLSFTAIDMKYKVEPGQFEIMVGNSSRDKDLIKVLLTVK
ncbi:MAG: glycoside hydrolase family 3 C-terminal domain-containing protein [Melioribacteraceae bacterium]|nr:glycoside hydrolase family 3 C-terminal domain-containing protein [Melioribacteraceae bacterium]